MDGGAGSPIRRIAIVLVAAAFVPHEVLAQTPSPPPDYRQMAYVTADGRERGKNGVAAWADDTHIAVALYGRVEVFGGTTYNQITGISLPSGNATIGLGGIGGDSYYLYVAETFDDVIDVIRRSDWVILTSPYINQPYKIGVNSHYFGCAGNTARIWSTADFSLATNLGYQAGDLYANENYFLVGDITNKAWKVYDAADFALATTIAKTPIATNVYGGGLVSDDYILATYNTDTSLYVHSQSDFSLHTVIRGRNSPVYDSRSYGNVCAVHYGNKSGDGLRFYLTDGQWSLLTMMTGIMSSAFYSTAMNDGNLYIPSADAFYVYGNEAGKPTKSVGGAFLTGTNQANLFWYANGNTHRVEWGTGGVAYALQSDFADSGNRHSFPLPVSWNGNEYYYRVWTDDVVLGEDSIAGADVSFNMFTMGLLADQQSLSPEWSANTQLHGRYNPHFTVSLGDQVEVPNWYSLMEWYGWQYPWIRRTPKIAVLGNHDDEPIWDDFYPVKEDSAYYSFDIGNVHFSVVDAENECAIDQGTAQWNWLSDDLWSTRKPWKVLMSHQGPYTAIYADGIQDSSCASSVVPLAKAAGVQAWIYGHNHMGQHIHVDGIDYIHVPAACGCYSYSQQTDWPAVRFYSQTEGFGILSCQSDTLSFSYYDFSGNLSYGPIAIESPPLSPSPTAVPSSTPYPSRTPSVDPTPSPSPSITPIPTSPPSTTPTPSPIPSPSPSPSCGPSIAPRLNAIASGDYDGDGASEIAVFRPSGGLWSVRDVTRLFFGGSSDHPASGDYDGDGTAEAAVFRPATGLWSVRDLTRIYLGASGDLPAPGDYDGDGSCDQAVFRGNGGIWSVLRLSRFYFGGAGDWPLPGDWDGDGKEETALFRLSTGQWMIRDLTRFYLGTSADWPVPGDYQGEGSWSAALFRPCSGMWALRDSTRIFFGNCFDFPVPADYGGDGTADIGVFRDWNGLWSARNLTRVYFGSVGDIPVAH